jgi:hypothetical protein
MGSNRSLSPHLDIFKAFFGQIVWAVFLFSSYLMIMTPCRVDDMVGLMNVYWYKDITLENILVEKIRIFFPLKNIKTIGLMTKKNIGHI